MRSAPAVVWGGIVLGAAGLLPAPAQSAVVNQWVQFGPDDTALIRAIEDTPANGCPAASLDGAPLTLPQRGCRTRRSCRRRTRRPRSTTRS